VAMRALEARVHVMGVKGERAIDIADFHLLPGNTPHIESALQPGELITHVSLPPLPALTKQVYLKLRDRASFEFALASAAVVLTQQGSVVSRVRIAMGGIGAKPWRVPEADKVLEGTELSEEKFKAAAEVFLQGAKPQSQNGFKIERSGFGGKLWVWPHSVLAASAARNLRRSVKLVVDRSMMFTNVGHRPRAEQRIQLGATSRGKLEALLHTYSSQASMQDDYKENCGEISGFLYNVPDVSVKSGLDRRNIGTPTSMRGPGAVPGLFALESGMDELAVAEKMDPVEFRLKNDTLKGLSMGKDFSSRYLKECLELGGEKFGWSKRNAEVGSMNDGKEIGPLMRKMNMASVMGHGSAKGNFDPEAKRAAKFVTKSFGAHFVEIGWQPSIARLRVRRVVTVINAGRIINFQPARNQIEGAIVMAVIAAAITSAVHHATGVRVRELPVKIENLLG
jgi:CO/xanthine dehydrogenase Mo-binding subunit